MPAPTSLFDVTGNLWEIVQAGASSFALMGGSYLTALEDGATCSNTSLAVVSSFAAIDAGFRCCFSTNPSP